ncbi:hypothetical protein SARC_17942, partial [Sphaeroforma arctica JP610]
MGGEDENAGDNARPVKHTLADVPNVSFWHFLRVAVLSDEQPSEQATEQKAKQVTDFFHTPYHLEK